MAQILALLMTHLLPGFSFYHTVIYSLLVYSSFLDLCLLGDPLLPSRKGYFSPSGLDSKESACNAGDLGLIPGSGRSPGEGNGNLLQYSRLENPMDRGYSPWGCKESNMTEQLTLSLCIPHSGKWQLHPYSCSLKQALLIHFQYTAHICSFCSVSIAPTWDQATIILHLYSAIISLLVSPFLFLPPYPAICSPHNNHRHISKT